MGYASRDNFQYGLEWFYRDFFPGVGSASLTKVVRMEQDSDFSVEKLCYQVDEGDLTGPTLDELDEDQNTVGAFLVRIRDSTTGRYWFGGSGGDTSELRGFVNLDTVAGSAQLPFILPTPKIMVANSEITVELARNGATAPLIPGSEDTNFTLVINFIGNKLFRR